MIGQNELASLKTCLNGTILFALSRIFLCLSLQIAILVFSKPLINQYTPTVYNFLFLLCNLYMRILFDEKQSNAFSFLLKIILVSVKMFFLSTEFKKIFCLFFLRAPLVIIPKEIKANVAMWNWNQWSAGKTCCSWSNFKFFTYLLPRLGKKNKNKNNFGTFN